MNRAYNFAAGPSMLPLSALTTAAEEMTNFRGSGMSVMEMSHRSKIYLEIFDETVALLRELMAIPDDYEVLLLQGGATGQFAAVPLNLTVRGSADYVDSGNFAAARPKRRQNTPMSTSSPVPRRIIIRISPLSIPPNSTRKRITYISPRTTRSSARAIRICRRPRYPWWRICPQTSCPKCTT